MNPHMGRRGRRTGRRTRRGIRLNFVGARAHLKCVALCGCRRPKAIQATEIQSCRYQVISSSSSSSYFVCFAAVRNTVINHAESDWTEMNSIQTRVLEDIEDNQNANPPTVMTQPLPSPFPLSLLLSPPLLNEARGNFGIKDACR